MKLKFNILLLMILVYSKSLYAFSDSLLVEAIYPNTTFTVGSSKSFLTLDQQLDEMNRLVLASTPPPPETDPSFAADFMVKLGKANLSKDVKKAKEICDDAIAVGRFIDKLTGGDLVTMPIIKKQSVGGKDVYIIFKSAKIFPQYAELEVYIKIDFKRKDFNGQDAILYFGARNIKFSQDKGIISGSVGLLADYAIKLAPNNERAGLYLKAMTITPGQGGGDPVYNGTFVNFDCDGFKEMGIGGAIFFSREWVIPTDSIGNPRQVKPSKDLSSTPRVNCHFQFTMQDWDDWLLEGLTIDHFVLTKWQKVSVYVGNANIDFSTVRSSATMPNADAAWEGVYIQKIEVTLPEPFKRKCQPYTTTAGAAPSGGGTCRIKMTAEHLMIDNSGVSGIFSVQGQAPLIGGPIMNGEWGWSLDHITLGFKSSNVDTFYFAGQLGVPILSKQGPLAYSGRYSSADPSQEKYIFTVETNVKKSFPIWNAAEVNILQAGIEITVAGGEFRPAVTVSGNLKIGNPADYKKSQTGSAISMPGLGFEDLKLQTIQPYISVGSITIIGGSGKVAGFPVTISDPTLANTGPNNELLSLAFTLGINLMDQGSGVSASGDLEIVGHYDRDINGARYWVFDDFNFNGASVELSLPHFYAYGQLCFYNDHPVYGNGFSARVDAKVIGDDLKNNDGKFNISMSAIFGSTDGYRYWSVDGFVSGSGIRVPLYPPFYLDGFGGGAFHHMRPGGYADNNSGAPPTCNSPVDYSGLIYVPNRETKLGLKFSTSIAAEGGTMEGMLTVIIRFGNNFNLQNIMFWGTAEIMMPKVIGEKIEKNIKAIMPDIVLNTEALLEKQKADAEAGALNKIMAKVGLSLDFEKGFIIHGFADVKINIASILTGSGTVDLLLPIYDNVPNSKWHFYLGGYYDNSITAPGFFDDKPVTLAPVTVAINYGNFSLSAHAYFLTGNDLPGPPPAHPDVVKFFGPEGGADNRGLLSCGGKSPAMGTGLAFGAACFFDFEKVKSGWFKSCVGGYKIDLGGGIGFDLALLKYNPSNSCQYGGLVGGINGTRATGRVFAFVNIEKGHITCIPLPHLGIGVKLRFDVIKPSYFQGVVKLDFIKELTFQVEFGEECGTPCSLDPIED